MRLSPHICERTNTMTDTNNYTDFSDNNSDTKELTTDNQGESNSSDAPSSDTPSSDAPSFGQHPHITAVQSFTAQTLPSMTQMTAAMAKRIEAGYQRAS